MKVVRAAYLGAALVGLTGCHLALGLPVARLESQVPGWLVPSNERVTAEKATAEWAGRTFHVTLILRADDARWALKVVVRNETGGVGAPEPASGRLVVRRPPGVGRGGTEIGGYEVTVEGGRIRAPYPLPLEWDEPVEVPPSGAAYLYLRPEIFLPEFPPPDGTFISFDLVFEVGGSLETAPVRLKIVETERHPGMFIELG